MTRQLPSIVLVALAAPVLLLGACGRLSSPGASQAVVRPIEEILVDAPQIEAGEISATVTATTRIPVACAVAYGTTHEYGSLATDADMAGGAHAEHHPLLTGLTPATVYYLRLQGVGPDGTLYRGDEFTFRTLPAAGDSAEANLAATARIVAVSSEYGGAADGPFAAVRAIDGDPATQWSSDGDGDDAWIEIELAAPTHVERVGFWTRTMGSSAQILSFRITTDQGEEFGPFELSNAAQIYSFDTDFTAQRLRFEAVETSGGNTGAVEIEVYGSPG
jgi:hypothetical protein